MNKNSGVSTFHWWKLCTFNSNENHSPLTWFMNDFQWWLGLEFEWARVILSKSNKFYWPNLLHLLQSNVVWWSRTSAVISAYYAALAFWLVETFKRIIIQTETFSESNKNSRFDLWLHGTKANKEWNVEKGLHGETSKQSEMNRRKC